MKQWPIQKILFSMLCIPYSMFMQANCSQCSNCSVRTFIPARSQGTNSVLTHIGITQLEHDDTQEKKSHGILSITGEYTNSFRPSSVSSALFGCDVVESRNILQRSLSLNLTGSGFQGITIEDKTWSRNNQKDWLADYFLLPVDFAGQLHFTPRVQNVIANVSFLGTHNGWFAELTLPIAWTKYDLSSYETVFQRGSGTGYDSAITNSMTLKQFFDTSCNRQTLSFTSNDNPITHLPLSYARICPCAQTKSGIADIHLNGGYTYAQPLYHLGAYARIVIPTGNHPEGKQLFEALLGNGHHVELGGGIKAEAILWQHTTDDKEISLNFDGNITHLFSSHQVRVFDLKNKPWSRYILAKQFDAQGNATGTRSHVANLTACPISVSYAYQTDLLAYLSYRSETFTYDLGYNFWARSCEKLYRKKTSNACTSRYAREQWGLGVTTEQQTESATTIHETIAMMGVPADTSPHYITTDDISFNTTTTKSATHKLFMHLGYAWLAYNHPPFVGVGGEVEFGSCDSPNKDTTCAPGCLTKCSCYSLALSQWGVWLKGGVAF